MKGGKGSRGVRARSALLRWSAVAPPPHLAAGGRGSVGPSPGRGGAGGRHRRRLMPAARGSAPRRPPAPRPGSAPRPPAAARTVQVQPFAGENLETPRTAALPGAPHPPPGCGPRRGLSRSPRSHGRRLEDSHPSGPRPATSAIGGIQASPGGRLTAGEETPVSFRFFSLSRSGSRAKKPAAQPAAHDALVASSSSAGSSGVCRIPPTSDIGVHTRSSRHGGLVSSALLLLTG